MKKSRDVIRDDCSHFYVSKFIKVMKLTFVILFIAGIELFATRAYSQKERVTLSLEETSVADVLNSIESITDYTFFYNSGLIDVKRIVSVNVQEQPVSEVLEDVFDNTDVEFKVEGNRIVLTNQFLSDQNVQQNAIKISGTVTDENGEIIPGVTILIKGSSTGTITDMEGSFAMTDVPSNATLEVSFIGMKKQEIAVQGRTVFDITLESNVIGLDEVVAIGYGTMKKSDLTGAVASVKGSVVSERQATQVSQALQGAMAGVMVTRDNSAPGATANIRIRGITTIGENDPLVIVDGVPGVSINDVNPNDIEDISVLKDAASASIYGSRAAAGVILITTKRAKSGDLSLNYNYEYGIEKPTELADYVGAKRWMEMENELRWNDNGNNVGGDYATHPADIVDNYTALHAENPDLYPDTDWMGKVLKNSAARQSHTLSLSGGSKNIRTKASLAYDKTDGLYAGRDYERLTARFNNDITLSKYLSASVDLYVKRSISRNPSLSPMYFARISAPIYAAEWTNGLVAEGKSGGNIYGQIKYGGYNRSWYNQVGGKIQLDFSPLDGLKLSAVVSPNFNYDKTKNFHKKVEYTDYDNPTVYVGTLQWASSTNLNEYRNDSHQVTKQFIANYTKSFGGHNLNLMAGYEDYSAFYETLGTGTDQMELSGYPYLNLANVNYLTSQGDAYENAYRSYFGRFMYNYNNKYFLQGNIRYDGSSRFAKDYRWGSFPSFSAGWVISEESFMPDIPVLSFLKLRGSWGTLGNERIGNYPYQSTLQYASSVFYHGSNVISSQTASQRYYAIEDISWETTESFDVGFDAVLFDGRLHINGDYYKKKTKDMLLELEIPDYIGFDNPNQNTGIMKTNGWELEVGWNDQIGDFSYSVSANISDFTSEMGDLGGIQFLGEKVRMEGSEFDEYYGYVSDGLFQTQEEVDNSAVTNASVGPGDIKYKDISGPDGVPDGVITPDYDRQLLGGSLPRYMYGGNVRLGYKNFDFAMAFQGVGKQNVRMSTMMVQPMYENWGSIQSILDGNYWSVYNTEAQNQRVKYPRLTYTNANNNYAMSDYWIFNGRYFRLKNVTLGYTLPKNICEKIKINNIRVYGSASDIFSLNKYPKGWDPEVSGSGYPITASYVLGVSVKF